MPLFGVATQKEISNALATETDTITALQQGVSAPPDGVTDYLAKLALLYGVPFENLVPDSRMLPPESLRFFYVDANWIESLVDGALSTGTHSNRDIRFSRVMRDVVREVTNEAAREVRSNLRGTAPPASLGGIIVGSRPGPFQITSTSRSVTITVDTGIPVTKTVLLTVGNRAPADVAVELNTGFTGLAAVSANSSGVLTLSTLTAGALIKLGPGTANSVLGLTSVRAGLLMRSLIVSGWPGLEIVGYTSATEDETTRIKPLRIERLSPNVMLVIFDQIPQLVVFNEPRETLHFGTTSVVKALRNPNTGAPLTTKLDSIPMRVADPSVLNIAQLVASLKDPNRLTPAVPSFTSATLAIEMIESAGKRLFLPQP